MENQGNITSKEAADKISRIQHSASKLLSGLTAQVALPKDYIYEIHKYQIEYHQLDNSYKVAGNNFSKADSPAEQEILRFLVDFERIQGEILELNGNVNRQKSFIERTERQVEYEKKDLVTALKYHKTLSIATLVGLIVIAVIGTISIYVVFAQAEPTEGASENIYSLILNSLAGKVTLILGLIWLIQFLGKTHSNHSEQAIIYQDKLAGLGMAQVIIADGSSKNREDIVKTMAETYLTGQYNAFRKTKTSYFNLRRQNQDNVSKKEVIGIVKDLTEHIAKVLKSS